ncbi:MAG: geranylgeranylglycerol-phosphate geranylgeranyltransferase [Flavobacteriales bacterium]|nr:geranylgeranylglycerol-phosphate geranylgeranyltransferase [Flavobacteriales bacterium]
MNTIVNFIKLIRIQNLLIIAATQYLLRYFIIKPLVEAKGFDLVMSHLDFFLLSLSTVLIAAAGYVINDYFDLKIDRINKPEEIIIGKHIKRRVAMGAHVVMNTLGFFIGLYVAYAVGNWNLAFIQIFAILSLWFYSTNFKFDLLAGNVIIAMMAALIPLMVGLYEVPLLNRDLQIMYSQMLEAFDFNFNYVAYWTIGYAIFAFLMTFAREITKDIADMEGDEMFEASTLPIKWGVTTAKIIISFLYLAVIGGVITVQQIFLRDKYTIVYITVFICLPLLYTIFLTYKSSERKQFLKASNFNKAISLFGILYAFLFAEVLRQFMDQQTF